MYRVSNRARRLRQIFKVTAFVVVPIAVINACAEQGFEGSLPCEKISAFTSSQDGIAVQTTAQFTIDRGGCKSPVIWTSSNSNILSVDQNGLVSALAAGGPVAITASVGSQSVSKAVRSIAGGGFSVQLSLSTVQTLHVGQVVQITAKSVTTDGIPTINQDITWSASEPASNSPSISVSPTGVVNALSPTQNGFSDAVVNAAGKLGGTASVRIHVVP